MLNAKEGWWAPLPDGDRDWRRSDWAALLFWLWPALVLAWCTAAGSGTDDTLRDLYFTAQISRAETWPTLGPVIGNIAHLGPVWYYVLAPAYAVGGAPAALAWAGFLSGLQFPLAYLLGRQLGGATLGWLAAASLLLPGWLIWSAVNPTHTALQPTLLLALIGLAVRYRRAPGGLVGLGLGLCASLALHAHPSNLFLVGVALLWTLWPSLRRTPAWAPLLGTCAGLLLPWLPLLAGGEPADHAVQGLSHYAQSTLFAPLGDRFGRVWWGTLIEGPRLIYAYWLHWDGTLLVLAGSVYATCAALGLAGLLSGHALLKRRGVAALGLIALGHTLFLLWLRPITPSWMAYALSLIWALALAMGWDAAWRRWPALRGLILAGLAFAATAFVAVLNLLHSPPDLWRWPTYPAGSAGLMSITSTPDGHTDVRPTQRPLAQLEALSRDLCAPTVAYGHLASALDSSFGLGLRRHCGGIDHVNLGGQVRSATQALIGLSPAAQSTLSTATERSAGLQLFAVDAVWTSSESMQITEAGRFPRRQLRPPRSLQLHVQGRAEPEQIIAVAWRALEHYPFAVTSARANGVEQSPLYADETLVLFRCDACAKQSSVIDWELQIDAAADWTDVLSFDPRRPWSPAGSP